MRFDDLAPAAADAVRGASGYLTDLLTPTLRIGVTGLSRAGKTVFITALVRALVAGGRLPFFSAQSQGRIDGAWLEPQPDDAVPRFDYEAHLAALGREPPQWPESTRSVSQLRVTIAYKPTRLLWRALGPSRLHVDIVDYPGEWLVDLALLERDFATWSDEAMAQAASPRRARAAAPFLAFLDRIAQAGTARDEQTAIAGARIFTEYLAAARAADNALATMTPGRFLMPGDLAGSPLLTFFPLPAKLREQGVAAGFPALLARRYESYKTHVVRPFFRDHFSKLDRQIVLVDALGALNAGAEAMTELQAALDAVLTAFRPGRGSWLDLLTGRRIDRLLFAATKADHLHHESHDRLEGVLRVLVERAMSRADDAGALVRVMAIAALRATREGSVRQKGGGELPVIIGVPLPGERIGDETFDGRREAAVFPGDLPEDARGLIEAGREHPRADEVRFVRFRPPRIVETAGERVVAPHIRLDRALEFLIGDRLA